MRIVEILLTAQPQYFSLTLSGVEYRWKLYWLFTAQCWVVDIYDVYENKILCGIPLVTGTDLLKQFPHIIEGKMFVISDQLPPDTVPDFVHLGITGHVYFAPPELNVEE